MPGNRHELERLNFDFGSEADNLRLSLDFDKMPALSGELVRDWVISVEKAFRQSDKAADGDIDKPSILDNLSGVELEIARYLSGLIGKEQLSGLALLIIESMPDNRAGEPEYQSSQLKVEALDSNGLNMIANMERNLSMIKYDLETGVILSYPLFYLM